MLRYVLVGRDIPLSLMGTTPTLTPSNKKGVVHILRQYWPSITQTFGTSCHSLTCTALTDIHLYMHGVRHKTPLCSNVNIWSEVVGGTSVVR